MWWRHSVGTNKKLAGTNTPQTSTILFGKYFHQQCNFLSHYPYRIFVTFYDLVCITQVFLGSSKYFWIVSLVGFFSVSMIYYSGSIGFIFSHSFPIYQLFTSLGNLQIIFLLYISSLSLSLSNSYTHAFAHSHTYIHSYTHTFFLHF